MQRRVEAELEAQPSSINIAREFVRATLAAWDIDDIAEVAALVTSELTTNAVRHARTVYRVRLELRSRELLIEVSDQSTALPVPARSGPETVGGRGLFLVERSSKSWGYRLLDDGKTVWAVLNTGAAPSPSG